ncbi:uncharacterized protein LOC111518710 [Drosophila willistoni]|uniref:uncharacterized protein LOC111518710 n=1 Tax=Drosophila willistoni TaxID=7260 RepID=UPI001F0826F5|nr:uncharacterized protein LOC111518710 [Drosophila willistoni]
MHYDLRSYRQARRQFSVRTYMYLAIWFILALIQWLIVCMIQEGRQKFRDLYYICFITFTLGILMFTIFIFCERLRYVKFINCLFSLIIVELQIISLFGLVVYSWWPDVLAFFGLCVLIIFLCLVIGAALPRHMDLTLDVAVLFIVAFVFLMVSVFFLLFLLIVWDTIPYAYIVVELAISLTIMFFVMYHAQTIHGNRFAEMRLDDFLLGSLILFHDFLIIYWLTFYWQIRYRPVTSDSYLATSPRTPTNKSKEYVMNTTTPDDLGVTVAPLNLTTKEGNKDDNKRIGYAFYDQDKQKDRDRDRIDIEDWSPSVSNDRKESDQVADSNDDRNEPAPDRSDWSVYRNRKKNRPFDDRTHRGKPKNPPVDDEWQDTNLHNNHDLSPKHKHHDANQRVPHHHRDIESNDDWILTTHDDINDEILAQPKNTRFHSHQERKYKKHPRNQINYKHEDVANLAQSSESPKRLEIVENFKDEVEILSTDDNKDQDEELIDEETVTTIERSDIEEVAEAIHDKHEFINLNKGTRKFDL